MKKLLLASAIGAAITGCGGSGNQSEAPTPKTWDQALTEPTFDQESLNRESNTFRTPFSASENKVSEHTLDYQSFELTSKNQISIHKAPKNGQFDYWVKDGNLYFHYTPDNHFDSQDQVILEIKLNDQDRFLQTLNFVSDQTVSTDSDTPIIIDSSENDPSSTPQLPEDTQVSENDHSPRPPLSLDNENNNTDTSSQPNLPNEESVTANTDDEPITIKSSVFQLKEDSPLHEKIKVKGLVANENVEIELVTQPTLGKLKSDGLDFTYRPNKNANGIDIVNIRVVQGDRSETAALIFNIQAVNDAPELVDVELHIDRATRSIQGTLQVQDPDSSLTQFRLTQHPDHGNLELNESTGKFTYKPDESNPLKEARFRVTFTDGEAEQDAEIALKLTAPLSDPAAVAAFEIDTQGGAPVVATRLVLLKEDSHIERKIQVTNLHGAKPRFEISSQGQGVKADIDADTGIVSIATKPNYFGMDSFAVKVYAGEYEVESWVQVIVTNVNDQPQYIGDSDFYILEDGELEFTEFEIKDVDGDDVSLSVGKGPNSGLVLINSGMIYYQPNKNFFGKDQFSLVLSDQESTVSKTFNIEVKGLNDRPTAIGGSIVLGSENHVPITLKGSDPESDPLTYKVLNADALKFGTLKPRTMEWHDGVDIFAPDGAVDLTDEFVYVLNEDVEVTEELETLHYRVTDTSGESHVGNFYIILTGDPLYPQQWHLKNVGQRAFAAFGGEKGNDLNIAGLHKNGVTGKGVTVLVADTGMEIEHEDLKQNVLKNRSLDLEHNDADPSPEWSGGGDHGTSVAGLIAAEMNNRKGGRGVAPEASLIGMNYLSEQSFESWYKSHGMIGFSDDVNIFNQSYGISTIWPIPFTDTDLILEEKVHEAVVRQNNDGKGALFVKAAGNGFNYFRTRFTYKGDQYGYVVRARDERVLPMSNINTDPYNASFFNISIGGLAAGTGANSGHLKATYSTTGSAVLLASPAGEYGETHPAMVTTDASGCNRGYSKNANVSFHGGQHPLNPDCHYTSTMNGTSSATPNAAGAFALLLGANPHLTWRDAKHLVLTTADPVDKDFAPVKLTLQDGEFVAEEGWTTNKVGLAFHNWYGFGRINVKKALDASKEHKPLPDLIETPWLSQYRFDEQSIPDNSVAGAAINFDPSKLIDANLKRYKFDPNFVIEGVQIMLSTEHERDADLSVELLSPASGSDQPRTRSLLLTGRNGLLADQQDQEVLKLEDDAADLKDFVMLSNAFYGEKVKGEWTLKVVDTHGGDMKVGLFPDRFGSVSYEYFPNNKNAGKVTQFKVRFYGHIKQ